MDQFSNKNKNIYDLAERTAIFGENIIDFCRTVKETTITKPIITQLIRSGTSIGANYVEATGASSKKDFRNKIFICKKESQETKYWLRIIVKADLGLRERARILYQEVHELNLIFNKITFSLNNPIEN